MANRNVARAVRVALFTAGAVGAGLYGATSTAQESLEEIVITGTRIANPNLTSASQVRAIGSEEISLAQVATAEELVRQVPGAVPSIGPGVNNGNNGTQLVNLRGLGVNRNVVLLDSRRVVPYGLNAVTDLNNIPVGLVERVDIVTGGATSVYGADAITGVVNFITKKDFEGAEVLASWGQAEAGDGDTWRTELLIGGNFAEGRGNAVFSIGAQDQKAVLQGDRSYGVFNISSVDGSAGGSSASAPTVVSAPGLFGQFNPATGTIDAGFTPFNFNPLNLYQTPVKKYNIFGQADYAIADNVEVYGQAFYTKARIETQIAPSATFFNTYSLPLSNPFLPAAARNQLCGAFGIAQADCDLAGATTDPNATGYREVRLGLRRRFVEWGPRSTDFQSDVFQVAGGLRGDITDSWSWDLGAQYGESVKVDTIGRYGSFSRAQQSLRAVSTTECQDSSGGCVPMNLFGPIGSMTQDMFDFIDAESSTRTESTLSVANLTFSGDLGGFKSPFAENVIGVAVGGEYREYTAEQAGDFLSQQPGELLGAGGADPAVDGRFDVREAYLEVIAPVVSDVFLVQSLDLEAGVRYSDYSTTGGATTWKAGFTWDLNDYVTVRSVYQNATRSPNISELFFPVQTVLDNFATDPCAGAAPASDSALANICRLQGAPASVIGIINTPAAGQVNITTGGNPELDVEEADTLTIGFIVQPLDNLTISLDYFNIKVDKAITNPEVGDIIEGCFSSSFNPSLTFNESCQAISRNAVDGSLNGSPADTKGVILQLSNLGKYRTDGFDLAVQYQLTTETIGRFSYRLDATYTNENRFQATPASTDRDCVGYYSTNCGNIGPELGVTQRLTWSYGMFDTSLRWRYFSSVEIEPALKEDFFPAFTSVSAYNYFDLTVRASVTDQLQLSLTVDNLLDKEPPLLGNDIGPTSWNSGNTYPAVYDAIGRTYTLGASVKF